MNNKNNIEIDHIKIETLSWKKMVKIIYKNNKTYININDIPHDYEKPFKKSETILNATNRYTQKRTEKIFINQSKITNQIVTDTKKRRKNGNNANIKYFKKYSHFSHWIDYITYQFSEKNYLELKQYLMWEIKTDKETIELNTSNNAYWITYLNTWELFVITKTKTWNWMAYTYSITYNTIPVPIFQFKIYNNETKDTFNILGSLKFYGSYFRIQHVGQLDDQLEKTLKIFTDFWFIKRIDYRYDFLDKKVISMPTAKKILPLMRKDKKNKPRKTWDILESWDCWSRINQTVFIRMYDKNIQLWKDLKGIFLYWDILNQDFKTFHRLEYQFWTKYCSWYQWKDIDKLIEKINYSTNIIPSEFNWTLYKPKNIIDLSNEIHRNRYIKIFKSMYDNL